MNDTSREPDFLPRAGAGCLILIGVFISALSAVTFFGGGGAWLVYFILGVGFLGSGVFWYRYVLDTESRLTLQHAEKEILNAARQHGGEVTAAQLVLETSLSSSEVERALAHLTRQGVTRPELLEDGTVSYRFSGLLRE